MAVPQKILLVGCGKMGSALLSRWDTDKKYKFLVLDPTVEQSYKKPEQLPEKIFNIIILAVKPQIMDEVLSDLTKHITTSLYVSIAAGKSLNYLEDILPDSQAIVRAMPNTPAMAGKGMTAACANQIVTASQKETVKSLFEMAGRFEWINDEKHMDAVTALSGSGPAYLFLLIEELAKAGAAQGLPDDLAVKLARQTVIGAAALAEHSPEICAAELRRNVTSPGGTTEAALEILMAENGLAALMKSAIEAAVNRSRKLS